MARGDLFPAPSVEASNSDACARGKSRSRQGRRCREAALVNEVVKALNWCGGSSSGGDSPVTSDHEDVLEHIHSCVRAVGLDVEELSTQEAARALLKGRPDYSAEKSGTTSLASYGRGEL